ncbi:MAG: hypothetical protein HC802_09645 [Caldilineaceae bacterium]|nr:hypothetical protein [Caldilineaceae bacterium]
MTSPANATVAEKIGGPKAPLRSLPALVAAMRSSQPNSNLTPHLRLFQADPLVPMYAITGDTVEAEAASAAQVVQEIAERLRRLANAYGEWVRFDAGAYFDLLPAQADRLVQIVERVNTVHITLFVDPLLPSFQQAEAFWQEQFCLAYASARLELQRTEPRPAVGSRFFNEVQPKMIDHIQRIQRVIHTTRSLLQNELSYLAMNDSESERMRWQRAWSQAPSVGLDPFLTPELDEIPSLTLAFDFSLPVYRQSGRLRRLRQNRRRQEERAANGRDRGRRARGRRS